MLMNRNDDKVKNYSEKKKIFENSIIWDGGGFSIINKCYKPVAF